MSALDDFLEQRAQRDSPAYAKNRALLEQRAYNQQQANKMAAASEHAYGNQAQGTKMYDPSISEQERFTAMQQSMLGSGLQGFQEQQANNLSNLQNSAMSNQGAMARHLTRSGDYKPPALKTSVTGGRTGGNTRQQNILNPDGTLKPIGPEYNIGKGVVVNTGDKPIDWTQRYNEDTWGGLESQRVKWHSAAQDIEQLTYTRDLLDQAYATGPADIIADPVRRLSTQLGFKFDKQATTDQLRGQLGDFAMDRIQDTKGSVSDAEMEFFKAISPSMGNTKEGNRIILQLLIDRATRDGEIGKISSRMQKAGNKPMEIEAMVNRYVENNPLNLELIRNFEIPKSNQTEADRVANGEIIIHRGTKYEKVGNNAEGKALYEQIEE